MRLELLLVGVPFVQVNGDPGPIIPHRNGWNFLFLFAFTVIGPDGREMIASFQEPDGAVLPMVTFSEESA